MPRWTRTATSPPRSPGTGPTVGLIAHVDTSPDAPGANVQPLVHRDHPGGPIELPHNGTIVDAPAGHDIVTSSGDTLLGADDKAGVAEIMTAVAHLAAHPDLPRPTLRICFTPDEEIGEGATLFDVERFGAVCAYTLDGSDLGELQDETFSAEEVILTIHGVDAHPGWAKDVLVNATRIAAEIVAALPPELTPERTDGRDGFIHVYELSGGSGRTEVRAIVRDFDDDKLHAHTALLRSAPPRRSSPATRARGSRSRSRRSTRTCAATSTRSRGPSPRPRRRSAPRASSSSAPRSAAARTAHA